jgi:hypothetical protein
MQILFIILSILAGIILLILIIALFIKKDYLITRTVSISAPSSTIFEYIQYLKNQDNYSKWNLMDPTMKKEYSGTDGTIGFVSAWESPNKNVGKGQQKITNILPGKGIELEIQFIKPFPGAAKAELNINKISDTESNVNWSLQSSMKYPSNIMLLVMNMDKMIGNDLEIGLSNLKQLMESK